MEENFVYFMFCQCLAASTATAYGAQLAAGLEYVDWYGDWCGGGDKKTKDREDIFVFVDETIQEWNNVQITILVWSSTAVERMRS